MAFGKKEAGPIAILAPDLVEITINVLGTAPFVQCKFSKKAKDAMLADMSTQQADKKSKKANRKARDYNQEFLDAQHISTEGWVGIPCTAFKAAMKDACRTVNEVMTRLKLAVFVEPDGFDKHDGTPLVKIFSKKGPEKLESDVRLATGATNIAIRAMWREWSAKVRVTFDKDMINEESVLNLLNRAGLQVGVGCGRPFSKNSVGMGWGTFKVVDADKKKSKKGE